MQNFVKILLKFDKKLTKTVARADVQRILALGRVLKSPLEVAHLNTLESAKDAKEI